MTPDTNQCQSASTVSQMHQQLAQMRLEIAAMVAEVESDGQIIWEMTSQFSKRFSLSEKNTFTFST